MSENLIVLGIVAVAATYLVRRVLRARKGQGGCGCGCNCGSGNNKTCGERRA